MATYSLGENTLKVPLEMHAANRRKLLAVLRKRQDVPDGSWIVLEGGKQNARYSSDTDSVFRQESYFFWTFGVIDADFYGAIDVKTGLSILFAPFLPEAYAVWLGKIHEESYFKTRYGVDEVYFYQSDNNDISKVLRQKGATKLLVLHGKNTDSGKMTVAATFPGIESFEVDDKILHPEMTECRVHKSEDEIKVMEFACKISAEAHKELMRRVRPGWYGYQAESLFQQYCYTNGGMRQMAYTCIAATGPACAVLHYGHASEPNGQKIESGDLALFDMGGEYFCYASDITTTFPVNGKFTDKQRLIYEAVLDANRSVEAAAKPGVGWLDMHYLAEKRILSGLCKGGILQSYHDKAAVDDDELNEMVKARLGAVFMPHGLGHFFGLDVHDVGGYPNGQQRLPDPGIRSLRTLRILEPGMTITVEPGCYFINPLMDKALADPKFSKWIVAEKFNEFRGFGGVRIEDNIVIRPNGIQCLTTSVPRTVSEIENFMATPCDHGDGPRH